MSRQHRKHYAGRVIDVVAPMVGVTGAELRCATGKRRETALGRGIVSRVLYDGFGFGDVEIDRALGMSPSGSRDARERVRDQVSRGVTLSLRGVGNREVAGLVIQAFSRFGMATNGLPLLLPDRTMGARSLWNPEWSGPELQRAEFEYDQGRDQNGDPEFLIHLLGAFTTDGSDIREELTEDEQMQLIRMCEEDLRCVLEVLS